MANVPQNFSLRSAITWLIAYSITATIVVAEETLPPASIRFIDGRAQDVPDFQKHVVPLLGRLGCNAAKCHGSFQGQGGFRLSLFGFDFQADHAALLAMATSVDAPRLSTTRAEDSLVLLKPSGSVDHEGGELFAEGSWEHHLLLRWIESGAKTTKRAHGINRIEVEPPEIIFAENKEQQTVRVFAVWEDDTREDVTCLSRFRTNNENVASVSNDGLVRSIGPGDSHIIVFYDNGVAAIPVLRRWSPQGSTNEQEFSRKNEKDANPIDKFVSRKLSTLGLIPSDRCNDSEFLRRLSIDLTGTLPTPSEVESFLEDESSQKRIRKVDELLERSAYAAWWANKLCDFTGCSPTAFGQGTNLEIGNTFATQWYDWLYQRVHENMSYDQLVAGIVLAKGRSPSQSREEFHAEMSAYVRTDDGKDFATRATMPHYWQRDSVSESKDKAMSFAHSFLGIQLQCAECHKHPFDQWTQADFRNFTRFFDTIRSEGRIGFPQFAAAQRGQIVTWPELTVGATEPQTLSLLRSGEVRIEAGTDPRQPLMDWIGQPNNPWFARAFVNRVWAAYFHVGIVDPPDQLTPSNPPSNSQLLDWLAQGFVESDYDMKWLHRQIATSETYQRSWIPNATNREDHRNFSRSIPRRIPAEVLYDGLKQATAATIRQDEVRNDLTRRATGHLSMRMAGTHAMRVFGKPDRALNCDCERVNEPSLLQSIFSQNDPLVRLRLAESDWIAEIGVSEATRPTDKFELIRQVWLRTVGRMPNNDEILRAVQHLEESESLESGVRELLWALLNTKEFLLNH